MAETKVTINRAVAKGYVQIQVQRSYGPEETLSAVMDVPIKEAASAVNTMFSEVFDVRGLSARKAANAYQLEQDLLARTVEERDLIIENKSAIKEAVKTHIKRNKKAGKYNG